MPRQHQICLKSFFLFSWVILVASSPPGPPIKCSSSQNLNCTITNSYGTFPDRSICRAAAAVFPATEKELVSVVANATRARRKIKVATRFSHSIPKLVCPDGQDGLLISTNFLNHTIRIDKQSRTITVESGVTLRRVISEAAAAGLALPYTPYWWGLTIGGILGTGAHGSSLWGKGSAIHDYVKGLHIVTPAGREDGFAKVRILRKGDKELNAAKVSLGVLGVISQVTLQLQPNFKRSVTYRWKNDSDLGEQAARFGIQHEFADITWYPSQRQVVYRIDHRIPTNRSGNEENQEATGDDEGKCADARLVTSLLNTSAYGLTNDGSSFTGFPVVGFQNQLQSSGACLDGPNDQLMTACAWDPRIKGEFFHETSISISLSVVKDFIQDVQQLVDLQPKSLCGLELYNGILMRYVKTSSAYLGKQEDAINFDITYYRSKDPMTPRLHEDILEEVEQMGVFKYKGLPHWGKNRNVAFERAISKYKNAKQFLNVKEKYDPLGLFSNEWTDQVLGLKSGVTITKKGCALEGLCICSKDVHCNPSKGYLCRPGKIYKEARVCTRITSR